MWLPIIVSIHKSMGLYRFVQMVVDMGGLLS